MSDELAPTDVLEPPQAAAPAARLLAWCVHGYTALGLVAAAGIAVLIVRGGDDAYRWAFVLMLAATVIDGTDGWLARRARVRQVLPGFDGRRLDDIIDFHTYTSLPLLLLWRAEVLPAGQSAWLLLPLLASAYGFSQSSAKTDDGFFLGFPSYWNVGAFYLYVLRPPGWVAAALLVLFAVLTFVPARYLYPSRRGPLSRLTCLLAALWGVLVVLVLVDWPGTPEDGRRGGLGWWMALASLGFPAYYLAASWVLSVRLGRKRT